MQAAQELQSKLSHADWALTKVGIAGVKAIVSQHFGYGTGRGRKPLGNTTITSLSEESVAPISAVVDLEKNIQIRCLDALLVTIKIISCSSPVSVKIYEIIFPGEAQRVNLDINYEMNN